MARISEATREALTSAATQVWERIAGSRGSVRGPYGILMHHPDLADRVAALGEYLRFKALLPGADRELAILATAREVGSRYEWAAHEPIGRREGVRAEAIETVRLRGPYESLTSHERVVVDVALALLRNHAVPDELYERGLSEFGREQFIELVTLIGNYTMVAFVLLAFEVEPSPGTPPAF